VEQPVLESRCSHNDAAGDTPSPEKKSKVDDAVEGEAVEEWWKLWREGESGGCVAAAANGYPRFIDDLSSVNAKVAAASSRPNHGTSTAADETADELVTHRDQPAPTAPDPRPSPDDETEDPGLPRRSNRARKPNPRYANA
jgi:hypothetical protein